MSELLEYALKYADIGLSVFPLQPRAKVPATQNGFKDATTDKAKIRSWWKKNPDYNIGIATGEKSGNLVVIDCDVDKIEGKDGYHTFLDWLDDNYLFLDDTWMSITGRGGYHIFIKGSEPVGSKVKWLEDVDVRANGGYVVAPPSIHENGNCYTWEISPEECNLLEDENTAFICDAINQNAQEEKSSTLQVPEYIGTGERNNVLYKLACSFQGKGLSDSFILSAVMDVNKTRCNPSLTEDEVRRIVNSALTKPKGTSLAETPKVPKPVPLDDIPLTLATDLLKMDLPDLEVIVGVGEEVPLLVEGVCVFSAKSKLGKSWFSLDLCVAVTKGLDFLGYKTKKCHALYFDLETVAQIQKKRLLKMLSKDEQIPGFYLVSKARLLGEGFLEQLEKYLMRDPEIRVVIVDVFQKIRHEKKTREADYDYMYREIGQLSEIAQKHHISIVLVTHDRKTVDPSDPFANILGSTALQGASDQMIVMYKKRFDENSTKLSAKGRTIDGLVNLDIKIENGHFSRCKAESKAETENAERIDAYMKSDIREGILKLAQYKNGFSGTCTEFINICAHEGIGVIESAVQVGTFFCSNVGLMKKIDNVLMENTSRGTGSKIYRIYPINKNEGFDEGFEVSDEEFAEIAY